MSQEAAVHVPLSKKRKKKSGLTGIELTIALAALKSVKSSLNQLSATTESDADDPQSQGDLTTFGSEFEDTVDKLLEMMQSKVEGPQVCLTAPCS
jgi:hypothetical protein